MKKWDAYYLVRPRLKKIISKISNLFMYESTYNILIFLFASVISPSIFRISKSAIVNRYFKEEIVFTIIAFIIYFGLAILVFIALHHRLFIRRLKGFKKINEIMSESFQQILNLFIEKMNLIKELKNKGQIRTHLGQLNEESFFKQLSIAMYSSLNEIFNNRLEIKIDIFRHERTNMELVPIHGTYINGSFSSGRPSSFSVNSETIPHESLAEYTFIRNKIGCIINIPYFSKIYGKLSEACKAKFCDKYSFYFKQVPRPSGFELGSLLCFPLTYNGNQSGILSIGFKESKLEKFINSIGINIEDFMKNIELFISKYTKFTLNTSQGIENVLKVFGIVEKQE